MSNNPPDEAVLSNSITALIVQTLSAIDQGTVSDDETNYKPLYYGLFNGISLILENVHTYIEVVTALKFLQCKAENLYIEGTAKRE